MPDPNPYAAPKSQVSDLVDPGDKVLLNRIASGQRLMIYSILVSMTGIALRTTMGPSAALISVGASAFAIYAAVRLSGALGSGAVTRILYGGAMIIPVVNLIVMLILSGRATRALRAGGYEVGLLGARQR
jgi:hypothetical protein